MRLSILPAAALGLAIGFTGSVEPTSSIPGHSGDLQLGISQAHAQYGQARRVSRRTSRRTSRRVSRRRSIAGCTPYRAYYNCGGVYYQAVVEGGQTVYVVVNP